MQTFASFVFLVKKRGRIEIAGDIIYCFEDDANRFYKEDCNPIVDGHEDMALYLDQAFEHLKDSFSPFVKTFPRIGQSKLPRNDKSGWHLSGAGLTYSKCCPNSDHYFSYEAETISGHIPQTFSVFAENLELYGIDITNTYNPSSKTMISSTQLGLNFSMQILPITEWDISSKAVFTSQVHRYAIIQ